MAMHKIGVTINGAAREAEVESRLLLVHLIREVFRMTGTHVGCDTSHCGACTVILDGDPVKSCTVLAVQADGAKITTVEGLEQGGKLHPVQEGVMRQAAVGGPFREHLDRLVAVSVGYPEHRPLRVQGRHIKTITPAGAVLPWLMFKITGTSPAHGSGNHRGS